MVIFKSNFIIIANSEENHSLFRSRYAIIYEKGYQRTENVVSAVTTKVQGLGYTNGTGIYENAGNRTWDSSDYVVPPQVIMEAHDANKCSLYL